MWPSGHWGQDRTSTLCCRDTRNLSGCDRQGHLKSTVLLDPRSNLGTRQVLFLSFVFLFFCFVLFCLFAFSRAAPEAYGGSQARDLIGAVVTGLHQSHSNAGSKTASTYTTGHGNAGSLTH